MLIWNQDVTFICNSDRIKAFCIDKDYNIYADEYQIASYSSYGDAIRNLNILENQIICGANTYTMPRM